MYATTRCLITLLAISFATAVQAADVLTPCFLKLSLYRDITGISVDDLVLSDAYPNDPDEVRYLTSFNTRDALPNNNLDDYGARIEGWITPQETGEYNFFLRSDDGAELYVSTDDTEANARLVAEETDCCDPFMEPESDDFATSLPINLRAGTRYFILVLYKEGSGGDFAQVAWRRTDDPTPAADLEPIPGAFLSTLASDADSPSVEITQQPTDGAGVENGSVTFEVGFTTTPDAPVCVQWQRNGTPIPGAVGSPVTLDLLSFADDGAKISAIVAVPGASETTAEATLSVAPDTTPPTLVGLKGVPSQPQVVIDFSERMAPAAATRPSNYQITGDGGTLAVESAELSVDGTQVTLTTAEQTVGSEYTVTFTNLTDLAAQANPLGADSTGSFFSVGKLLQGNDGFVIWEAEEFDRNTDERWVPVKTRTGASEGVAMLIPNGAGGNEVDTQLQYDIIFTKTGTHVIWYRAGADSGSDDSAWMHLDGERPSNRLTGNQASMSGFNGSTWEWNSNPQDGSPPFTFEITEAGEHTISVARREDGAFFDKFLITTDLNFDPTDFGELGPAVTRREGEPAPDGVNFEITTQPSDVEGLENTSASVTAIVEVPEGTLSVLQWQRENGGTFEDIPGASLESFTIDPLTMDWNGAVVRLNVTVGGATISSDTATITVVPETEAPQLLRATGVASAQRVTLSFSEPLEENSATDTGNYEISGGGGSVNVTGATLLPNGITVLLDTGTQRVGTKYTVTVNGVTDTATTPNAVSDGIARYYALGALLPQSDEGLLVFEAESFTANLDDLWMEDSTRGTPSGGVSMVNPNGAGGNEGSTKLEYDLEFTQTGTHIIWYRASAPSGSDDSAWLHVDGDRPPNRTDGNQASMTGFSGQADFIWTSDPQDGPSPMTFEIDTTGIHTIGLARREDGAFFDKFAITTDPDFDPNDFGPLGPPETRAGAPPLPSIQLTGPADLASIPAGESVTLTVDVTTNGRDVARVVYVANDVEIGEATEAPFDFVWEQVPVGAYLIRARLIDDVGDSVGTSIHSIVVGEPNELLMVVGNPDLDNAPGDQAIVNRLNELGFQVVVVDDNVSQPLNAFGRKLIIISSTVNSGTVNTKFRDATIPVLLWEQANQDDFAMTANEADVNRGGTDGDQTALDIVLADHPLNGGFPVGELTIADTPTAFTWGQPTEDAIIAATVAGDPDRAALYGYETGATMIDGFVAPARRVMAFLTDEAYVSLNADGRQLFEAALSWALGETLDAPGSGGAVTVQITSVSATELTLAWEGTDSPVTIQRASDIANPDWMDIGTGTGGTATVPVEGETGFFRVVAP